MQVRKLFLPVRRMAGFIFTLIAAHLIALVSGWCARLILPLISNMAWADILYRVVFYSVQIILPILALLIFTKGQLNQAGFNMHNKAMTLRLTALFLGGWAAFITLFYGIFLAVSPGFRFYVIQSFPLEANRFVNNIVIGGLLAGIGEEPLFRALVTYILMKSFGTNISIIDKKTIWVISILTGVIFMSAHIDYVIVPAFSIVSIDPLNLASTLVLGTIWSMIYLRTKSLLGPILAHSGANIIQYSVGQIAATLL